MTYAHSERDPDRHTRARRLREAQGAVLRARREAAGRSLADVAAAAQCSPAHLSDVERGRKDASSERLAGIAAALDVPLHALFAAVADALAPPEMVEARAAAADPRAQLRLAAASLEGDALRTVAQFSSFLISAAAPVPSRRIGFALPGQKEDRAR